MHSFPYTRYIAALPHAFSKICMGGAFVPMNVREKYLGKGFYQQLPKLALVANY